MYLLLGDDSPTGRRLCGFKCNGDLTTSTEHICSVDGSLTSATTMPPSPQHETRLEKAGQFDPYIRRIQGGGQDFCPSSTCCETSQLRRCFVLSNWFQFLERAGECVRETPHGSRLKLLRYGLKVQLTRLQVLRKPEFEPSMWLGH